MARFTKKFRTIGTVMDQKRNLEPDAGLEPAALRYLYKSLTLYRLS